ncbi:SpoIIIAH-like family protein [uncultured Ruminococcus sp.]|uniref:SpoIIIAH-like family protein n=1 Tax=uncultured Ruminococcus sp. TaxID=165186 RepID=UPI0026131F26|nr:SpoIIIAH-like family protein [uncultured Ruminococcus sp.]
MKKPSLIIGKKQIILSCLTLMLAIAVYVNYAMSDGKLKTAEVQSNDGITYGDTAFVNAQADDVSEKDDAEAAEDSTDASSATADASSTAANAENVASDLEAAGSAENYFAQARLERTASRDESVATLQSILGGGDRTEDELVTDAIAAVETSKLIESESTIESLIKAQGYPDCIVYLDGESAKVVVQTEGLDAAQAAAIKDIILGEVSISAENIRIFEVK